MIKLIGKDSQIAQIRNLLGSGKFPHCLLVSGARGLGKKTFARKIAQSLVCEKGLFDENCACLACRKVEEDHHPDVRWIGLDEEAYSIKIEEIRELMDWANLKPFEAERKIFILVGSERMKDEAANAFLKTLEEPPAETHFILLTENPFNLRETLLSRCIRIKMTPLPFQELVRVLTEQFGMHERDAVRFSKYSQGNLGKALEFKAENPDGMRAFFLRDLLPRPLDGVEHWQGKKRVELLRGLDFFSLFLRDMMVWKETGQKAFLHEENLEKEFEALSRKLSLEGMVRMLELADETRAAVGDNTNPKIALFRLGLNLKEIS
ncbi:MAG TPA: DNA polymerase III subunit delta' [Candidatus Omnitrophota bacterium]|nr:DNA polymerase III subunit delta' [Candidatus Omnitrophota bacterium]